MLYDIQRRYIFYRVHNNCSLPFTKGCNDFLKYFKYLNIFKVTTVCLFVRLMTPCSTFTQKPANSFLLYTVPCVLCPFILYSPSLLYEKTLLASEFPRETCSALRVRSRQSRHSCKFLQVGPFNIYLTLKMAFE